MESLNLANQIEWISVFGCIWCAQESGISHRTVRYNVVLPYFSPPEISHSLSALPPFVA